MLPDDAAAQVKAGNFLLVARQFEDAKTRASNVLTKDAKNVDAQILLGNAQAGLKNFDEALSDYQQATTLNPTDDRAYSNTGVLQIFRGQKAEAEASFRKAVEVAPKSISAHMALANFFLSNGRIRRGGRRAEDGARNRPREPGREPDDRRVLHGVGTTEGG